MLLGGGVIRKVHGISDTERQAITTYIQSVVDDWCKNMKNEWFTVRSLFGGDNSFWGNIPLDALYQKHANADEDDARINKAAGRDAGWLLKKVLEDDKRTFETRKGYTREYRWVVETE